MSDRPQFFSFTGFLKLTRTWNLLIVAFTQLMTAVFILEIPKESWMTLSFLLFLFSTGAVAAAGYIINDYYDIKIDFVNKPERVVIGKKLKRRSAMLLHALLTAVALAIGYFLDWRIGLIHSASSIMLWYYSNSLKRLPFWGNLSIALLTGITLVIVGVYFKEYNWPLYLYTGFAFFFTLIREIVKDLEDKAGDEKFGCKTLPIVWGIPKTKKFVYLLMAVFVLSLVYLNFPLSDGLKNIYLSAIFFMVLAVAFFLVRADKIRDFRNLSRWLKWITVFGVLSMVMNKLIEW